MLSQTPTLPHGPLSVLDIAAAWRLAACARVLRMPNATIEALESRAIQYVAL